MYLYILFAIIPSTSYNVTLICMYVLTTDNQHNPKLAFFVVFSNYPQPRLDLFRLCTLNLNATFNGIAIPGLPDAKKYIVMQRIPTEPDPTLTVFFLPFLFHRN